MFLTQTSSFNRLNAWRRLRKSFSPNPTMHEVVSAFNITPQRTRYIDYYIPKHWPNVFEIVNEGMFCQSGISIILAATLIDLKIINSRTLHFDVISSQIDSIEGLVLKVDNKYLNFVPGTISTEDEVKRNGTVFDSHIITADKIFC